MAEIQEDKPADVKTLYKEPFFKQRNTSFWWHLLLWFLFSRLCHKVSPRPPQSTNTGHIRTLVHPFPTWGTHFSKDLYELGSYQTVKSSPVWVCFFRYDSLSSTPHPLESSDPVVPEQAFSLNHSHRHVFSLLSPPSGLPWSTSFFFSHRTTHPTPAKDEFSYCLDFPWQRAQSSFHSQTPLNWMLYEKDWVFSVLECSSPPPLHFTPQPLLLLSAFLFFPYSSHHTVFTI